MSTAAQHNRLKNKHNRPVRNSMASPEQWVTARKLYSWLTTTYLANSWPQLDIKSFVHMQLHNISKQLRIYSQITAASYLCVPQVFLFSTSLFFVKAYTYANSFFSIKVMLPNSSYIWQLNNGNHARKSIDHLLQNIRSKRTTCCIRAVI